MNGLKKWACTAVVAVFSAVPAAAQTGGISSGGTTGGLGLGGGSGALTSSGLAGTLNSGGGSGTNASGLPTQPQIIASNGYAKPMGNNQSSLSSDNFLAGYYADPRFQGIWKNGTIITQSGGFGTARYTSSSGTSTTGTGTSGTTRARGTTGTSTLGTTGTLGGGRIGTTGTTSSQQSGIVVPLPVQINYAAQLQFAPSAPIAPSRLHTDLRASIDNSSLIPSGKNVQILADVRNNVTLRGTVADENEARLIEGVVRLTPGVGEIRNDLVFPLR